LSQSARTERVARYHSVLALHEADMLTTMPFVSAAGVEVPYVEHGSSDAQTGHTAGILPSFRLDHRHTRRDVEPSGGLGWLFGRSTEDTDGAR